MGNNIPWDIIAKYLRDIATPEEESIVESWIDEDETHPALFEEIRNVYILTSKIPSVFQPDKERAWRKINMQIRKPGHKVKKLSIQLRYAAAAVILLLVAFTFFWTYYSNIQVNDKYVSEIIAPPGHKTMVKLPDSTVVWLNSGSVLKYDRGFNIDERVVSLEGEAFFEVNPDKAKKFKVHTGVLSVQVYGTAFNVKNYEDDVKQEITVSEGRVGISDGTKEHRQLVSGDQAVLNKQTNIISFSKTDPDIVSSWKDNELKFDDTPFVEVVKYLERWYGVDIAIEPSMVGKHNYTFKIKTESLTEILEKIKLMTPISYEINGKEIKIYTAE